MGHALGKLAKTNLQAAMRHMVACAQLAYAQVSRAIGRNDRYLSIMLNDATTPRLDLMAKIANACGYDVYLVGHGEALEVTPEPCDGGPVTVTRRYSVAATPDGGLRMDPETVDRGFGLGWDDDLPMEDEPPTITVSRKPRQ